ncbi:MAG: GAF domain-containing protein [Myxococcaceae bacterium]|nr:GAF domain-containing protein [Myxococcaceae bacterium]
MTTGAPMEQRLESTNRLLRALTEAQTEFIRGSDAQGLFNRLLGVLLELTDSEYGFIGEVLYAPEGVPYLRTYAITNIAWTGELREVYARQAPLGMEFRNLRTLFGAVMTSGKHVLSNNPSADPRSGGVPPGHPPLRAFLGLPFNSGGELVGMVGIANRPGGYDQGVIDFLQPFLATCCSVILGGRSEQQRRQAEETLRHREEELRRHRDHLEELVQVRTEKLLRTTKELERHQLSHQEKLIALGELAGTIAHEINSPMGYVMSNLSMLTRYIASLERMLQRYREFEQSVGAHLQGPQAEALASLRTLWEQENLNTVLADVQDLLGETQEGTQRVKDIIQSLKQRMQHQKEEAYPQLVDLNKELATALKMMAGDALEGRCEVRTAYGEVPPILGFPIEISQVFTHLLSNAAGAIADRGEIRVTTKQEGEMVVVSISDTGHGMPPEVQARIFTPFFTTRPPGRGTGLGLAISYNIISRHHGRIEVQSQPGQGTTFTLRLPAAPEALRAAFTTKAGSAPV